MGIKGWLISILMQAISDSRLLNQLQNEDNASFALLYRFYYPAIEAHIIRNSGSQADAEDVFQEAIVVLLQQIRRVDFVLTSSLKTYLFAIARNLWLKRLRETRYTVTGPTENDDQPSESPTFDLYDEPTPGEKITA